MTRRELIAEILTEFKKYDESGLIDYRSLNRWIKNEIKRFGNNVMQLTEKVLRVENGIAELPENFFNLYFAVKCTPESHCFEKGDKTHFQSSYFYTQRLENTYEWDNQSNSHKGVDFKCIEEKLLFNDASVTFRYSNPILMKPVKGLKREFISNVCPNLKIHKSPYEFNIVGEKVQVNFKEGDIYIQYYGLPLNEDNDLEIPDNRNLQEYLIAYCKRKIIEMVWSNDDDTNLINKLQYFKQEEDRLYGFAQTSVKFENLGNWDRRIRKNNIRYTNKFEKLFPM